MAIGTIGGIVAGVGAIGGALIGAGGAKSAANKAAQSADAAAQVQREIYGQNKQTLQPFVNTGTAAMGNINALLGITPTAPTTLPATGNANTGAIGGGLNIPNRPNTTSPANTLPAVTQPTAQQAFDRYRNSTGYQFRVNEGMDALNSGFAGSGTLQSGAALRSLDDYRQGMASQEFGNYMSALGNQQALGLSGASALAGVGQNYANSLGTIHQQNGANQANAALAGASMLGGGINSLGNIAGNILGRNAGTGFNPGLSNSMTNMALAGIRVPGIGG